MRERDLEDYLLRKVAQHKAFVRKIRWIGRRDAPDRLLKIPGGAQYLVELKKPGEQPRHGQLVEHDELRKAGFDVRVVDSYEGVNALFK